MGLTDTMLFFLDNVKQDKSVKKKDYIDITLRAFPDVSKDEIITIINQWKAQND